MISCRLIQPHRAAVIRRWVEIAVEQEAADIAVKEHFDPPFSIYGLHAAADSDIAVLFGLIVGVIVAV